MKTEFKPEEIEKYSQPAPGVAGYSCPFCGGFTTEPRIMKDTGEKFFWCYACQKKI